MQDKHTSQKSQTGSMKLIIHAAMPVQEASLTTILYVKQAHLPAEAQGSGT